MSKKDEDLSGFEDLIKQNPEIVRKQPNPNTKAEDGFALLSFLEKESKRLDRLIGLFDERAYILKNYPQDLVLQIHQEAHNSYMREQLVEKLMEKNSPLMRSLAELYNAHFRD